MITFDASSMIEKKFGGRCVRAKEIRVRSASEEMGPELRVGGDQVWLDSQKA
jgi:hypothetical protein